MIVSVNIYQYLHVTKNNCFEIAELYPKTSSLYNLLDVYNRRNLMFKTIFIGRRFATAIVYVTLKNH